MSTTNGSRRQRVPGDRNNNIYRRSDGKFEIGYRDSDGRQRWQTVSDDRITAVRAVRDDLLGRKGRGERVVPNRELKFAEAAAQWIDEQVAGLRPATQAAYRNAIDNHLNPRWGRQRLDRITVDEAAKLIRELRAAGKAEWTIASVLNAANRTFKFARRRLNWHGQNPITDLDRSERPKVSAATSGRIYEGEELAQSLDAAREPYRTLFALASVTGARLSECLGLTWQDMALDGLDAAEITFMYQVDRQGRRAPLKTEAARRTVEIPRQLAAMLVKHKLASPHAGDDDFVFVTRTGRALSQRNVARALRETQRRATDGDGRHTFPILHERDENGKSVKVPHGAVPSFHSFRHSAASDAIDMGDSAEDVSWQLGHANSNVTRAIYIHKIKSAEQTARRRAAMEQRYGSMLGSIMETAQGSSRQPTPAKIAEAVPESVIAQ